MPASLLAQGAQSNLVIAFKFTETLTLSPGGSFPSLDLGPLDSQNLKLQGWLTGSDGEWSLSYVYHLIPELMYATYWGQSTMYLWLRVNTMP